MKWFQNREKFKGYHNYTMKNYVDKKRHLVIIAIIVMLIVMLLISTYYIVNTIQHAKIAKQYEKQLVEIQKLKQEEQDKQQKIKQEIEKKKQEKLPQLTEVGKENCKHIYSSETKRAFLTFDDGPSSVTPTILDVLKQENVKATFFMLGSNIEKNPAYTKRAYEEGHFIANHGYSHSYSSIYSSPQAVLDEYQKTNDVITKAIGVPEYNSHLFRFPGGFVGGKYAEIKRQAKELLLQNDIVNVDWNALTGDAETTKPTPEGLMANLQKTTQGKNSVVILMHDAQAKQITAEMLPQIIAYLREQGYELKNFYEIIK